MNAIATDSFRFIPPDNLDESSLLLFGKPTSTKNLNKAESLLLARELMKKLEIEWKAFLYHNFVFKWYLVE